MNILYINHYAGSPSYGMEFRPFYLAKEWIKLGHNVTIIGANYSHLRSNQPQSEKNLHEEYIEGVRYLWINTPKYQSSGVMRILNILTFVYKLFRYRKSIVQRVEPDVVIASSTYPLDIYPVNRIAKRSKAKLIFELHDMWPLSPMLIGGYSKYHPFIWIMQKAENFACKNSNGYVSMLGNAEEYLIEHGLKIGKFTHITNGFHEDDWFNSKEKIPSEHLVLINKLKQEYENIVGYAGGHAPSNSLETLIKTAKHFEKKKVAFLLVGKGPSKDELIKKTKELNLINVFFLPSINKNAVPDLLQYFDIAFIAGIKSRLHYYGTAPNKLTDYMLASKPIIFALDEPNSLVEKVNCGVKVPAENEVALIKTINQLLKLSTEERKEMGEKGREYALKELNYTSLAQKFIDAIEKY